VTVPSAVTDAVSEAARQAAVVVSIGVNERDDGSLYNAQLLFDPNGTTSSSRAAHTKVSTTPLFNRFASMRLV
jgi:nitrilase